MSRGPTDGSGKGSLEEDVRKRLTDNVTQMVCWLAIPEITYTYLFHSMLSVEIEYNLDHPSPPPPPKCNFCLEHKLKADIHADWSLIINLISFTNAIQHMKN